MAATGYGSPGSLSRGRRKRPPPFPPRPAEITEGRPASRLEPAKQAARTRFAAWITSALYAYDSHAFWPHHIGDCSDVNGWVYTLPTKYPHYHLGYENSALCYGTVPGKLGVWSGGSCVHTKVIKSYVNDKNTGARKTFKLLSIHLPLVVPDQPSFGHIKLWIQKANGEWRYWADLTPGTTWNLPRTRRLNWVTLVLRTTYDTMGRPRCRPKRLLQLGLKGY